MSHHFDTPTAREDPRLNLSDLYLFAGSPTTTAMAMTVNPQVDAADVTAFRDEGRYAFRFDTDDDRREDVTFTVQFGAASDGGASGPEQTIEVRRGTGTDAGPGGIGEVVAHGRTGSVTTTGGVRVFAGVARDVFAGDSAALRSFEAAFLEGRHHPEAFDNHVNFFHPRHVGVIVLEVPNDLIGTGLVHAWATISLVGHAPETQVARWGLPLITHLYLRDDDLREEFNRSRPSDDASHFTARIARVVRRRTLLAGSAADPAAYAQRLLTRLGPLALPYEIGSAASFDYVGFNGRGLRDDVMDVMLSLTTNTALADGVAPDATRIRSDFPYFDVGMS